MKTNFLDTGFRRYDELNSDTNFCRVVLRHHCDQEEKLVSLFLVRMQVRLFERMYSMYWHLVLFVTLFSLSVVAPAYTGFEEGQEAYESGDYVRAYKEFKALAEHGNVEAQLKVALMYEDGRGVQKNTPEAVKWFRRGAEQGSVEAQLKLGLMYDEGKGVPKNYAEAAKWFRKAAEQGMAEAQYNLGVMYHEGQGVTKDYSEVLKWLSKAARQGLADAQSNLGVMYARGEGVPKDLVQAYMWFDLAAARGNPKASKYKNKVAESMSSSQIAEAQRLALEWKSKGQD
jgi:uncharacterized protein